MVKCSKYYFAGSCNLRFVQVASPRSQQRRSFFELFVPTNCVNMDLDLGNDRAEDNSLHKRVLSHVAV